ncbi:MAG TPA: class I SAM-dependent methyltransferase [Terracidiphilus sp.]|jgi:SAM-dependent methyltransferase|nr:class I SAM-dependent methyltransferase [Terracidiphilus sp.]
MKLSNAIANTADFEFAALREAKNYRAALLEEFGAHLYGNVLEVGCGIGQITEELLRLPGIEELVSIEPDATFCERLRSRLPEHRVIQGTISDIDTHQPWNAIISINVLEHIESDLQELVNYCELLRPARGVLCLFVPSRPEIYAPIDRDFGHFRRYTRAELKAKLREAGFDVLRIRYYNLIGYFLWYLNFKVLKKRAFDLNAVRLFDRAIFPLIHKLEARICAPPIGQSLIVVAIPK